MKSTTDPIDIAEKPESNEEVSEFEPRNDDDSENLRMITMYLVMLSTDIPG